MKRSSPLQSRTRLARSPLNRSSRTRSVNGKAAAAAAKEARRAERAEGSYRFRTQVAARDQSRCRRCGDAGAEAHHAAQKSTHPQWRYEPAIGVYLCSACHRHVHDQVAEATSAGWLVPAFVQDLELAVDWIAGARRV